MIMSTVVRFEFSKLVASVGVVGLFAVAGAAQAQDDVAKPSEAAAAAAQPAATIIAPSEPAAPAVVDAVAPTDGVAIVTELERGASVIRQRLDEARRQHDVVKTLCLDDKLSQMDKTLVSAGEHAANQKLAFSTKDAELAAHEGVILKVFRQRGDQLNAEANTCIGEEAAFVGDTKVAASVDPGEAIQENADYPAYGTAVPGAPNAPGSLIGLPVSGVDVTPPPDPVSPSL